MPIASSTATPSASGSRSLDTARYQVLERRDVRTAVEFELLVVPGFIVAELVLFGRSNVIFAFATVAALAALGLLALLWRLGRRRRPHPTAFLIGVIIFAMGTVGATSSEVVATLMSGFFAVVVIGCAVWMPWSPRWHLAFLAMAVFSLVVGLALAPISTVTLTSGMLVGVGAVISSGLGYWMVRYRHLRMWGQALELRRGKAALTRTVRELEDAQHLVRRLEGILPICASCKRIRDGEQWTSVEGYVSERTDAQFSHGICPDCLSRLYPDESSIAAQA